MDAQSGKEKQVLISFIVPTYNVKEEMIRQCIDSINDLSLRDNEREIIIVDDGSEVSTLTYMKDMTDEVIYVRQRNQGVAVARNTGLKMASGQFVQFVDADDMLLKPYEHVIDRVRFENVDMVMFDFTDTAEAPITYSDEQPVSGAELMRNENIHGAAWGYVFKKNILGSLNFTPGIAYGEDEEFTALLTLRAERVCRTSAKAYYYRTRDDSAINKTDTRSKIRRLADMRQVIAGLSERTATMPIQERRAMQRRVAQLTMDYIYNVIMLTRSQHYLNRQIEWLSRKGLYPLPEQDYTKKYKWFRRISNTEAGLTMLLRTLPLLAKEK